jgi:hypothetical protein
MTQEPPAGAARIIIGDKELEALLNLPEGIHVHHSFTPGSHLGAAIGVVLVTDTPGLLPPYEATRELAELLCEMTVTMHEGKSYYHVQPILPKEK